MSQLNPLLQAENGISNMSNNLEEKMKTLIDGYEYLNAISSEIPRDLQDVAAKHKHTLLDSMQFLQPTDNEFLESHTKHLGAIQSELDTLSHARILIDISNREVIREARFKGSADNSRNGIMPSNLTNPRRNLSRANAPPNSVFAVTPSTLLDEKMPSSSSHIHIPHYSPPPLIHPDDPFGNHLVLNSVSARYLAKYSQQGYMLPAMRQGSLPPELRQLKTSPTDAMPLRLKKSRTSSSPSKRGVAVKHLKEKFSKTELEVMQLREALQENAATFTAAQARSEEELKKALSVLYSEVHNHDQTIARTIGKLVSETTRKVEAGLAAGCDNGFERVLSVSSTKREFRVLPSNHLRRDATTIGCDSGGIDGLGGYKILYPTGTEPPVAELPNSSRPSATTVSAARVEAPTAIAPSLPAELSSATPSHLRQQSAIEDFPASTSSNRSMPSVNRYQLVGDRSGGVRWQSVADEDTDDAELSHGGSLLGEHQFGSAIVESDRSESKFYVLDPYGDHASESLLNPLQQLTLGGGQLLCIQSDKKLIDHSSPTGAFRSSVEPNRGNLVEVGQCPEQSLFPPSGNGHLQLDMELVPRNAIGITGVGGGGGSQWASRVQPLRRANHSVPGDTATTDAAPTAPSSAISDNYDSSNRNIEQNLIELLHHVVANQNATVLQTQEIVRVALMRQHDAAVTLPPQAASPPETPSSPAAAVEEATAVTNFATSLISAIKEATAAAMVPQLPSSSSAAATAVLAEPTIPRHVDVSTNVSDSDFSGVVSQEPVAVPAMPTSPLDVAVDLSAIKQSVQEGIQEGVRVILDIICPTDDDPSTLPATATAAASASGAAIRGHIDALDRLEQRAKRPPQPRHGTATVRRPSFDPYNDDDVDNDFDHSEGSGGRPLLHLTRIGNVGAAVEAYIDRDVIASAKRLQALQASDHYSPASSLSLSMDEDVGRVHVYRESALHSLGIKKAVQGQPRRFGEKLQRRIHEEMSESMDVERWNDESDGQQRALHDSRRRRSRSRNASHQRDLSKERRSRSGSRSGDRNDRRPSAAGHGPPLPLVSKIAANAATSAFHALCEVSPHVFLSSADVTASCSSTSSSRAAADDDSRAHDDAPFDDWRMDAADSVNDELTSSSMSADEASDPLLSRSSESRTGSSHYDSESSRGNADLLLSSDISVSTASVSSASGTSDVSSVNGGPGVAPLHHQRSKIPQPSGTAAKKSARAFASLTAAGVNLSIESDLSSSSSANEAPNFRAGVNVGSRKIPIRLWRPH